MNRKGIELSASFIIVIIIVVITFFIIFTWLTKTGLILNYESDKNACKLTLSIQAKTKLGYSTTMFHVDSPFKTKCKRRTVEITEEAISIVKTGPDSEIASYDRPTDKVIAQYLANSMRDCWDRGLEGKEPIFNDRGFHAARSTVCLICDEIDVQVSGKYLGNRALPDYLVTEKMPGTDKTYEQYLFTPKELSVPTEDGKTTEKAVSGEKTECMTRNNINPDVTIQAGAYATVLYRDFSKYQQGCIATYVVPAEQLVGLCDYVAN